MKISNLTEKDLPELAGLYQQLIPNDSSISKMKTVFTRHKDDPNHVVLVAKENGKLAGSLLAVVCEMFFGQCKSFMVVEDLVIDKAHRRLGIGADLMQHIEDYARKNNVSYIMLMTDTDRTDAQNFYKSLGYKTEEYCAYKKKL